MIAFVPGFYTITSVYLVENTPHDQFGFNSFIAVLITGLLVIGLNYWSDQQKLEFRATDGKCVIWGKPAKLIRYNLYVKLLFYYLNLILK